MNDTHTFYITTAIDYINAKPHIGHAYEKVASDVLARYYSMKLGKDQVFFLTGTDEHGAKIAKAAAALNMPIEQFAQETAAKFSFAWDQLDIVPNRFIRTTDADHLATVTELLEKIKANGHVYEGEYKGLYCTACETFYTETDAHDGLCPVHHTSLEPLTEKNWFLKISNFTESIKQKIQSDELLVWPVERKHEILSLLDQGFNDIAISRPNVKWGIPLPWDTNQTVYVWVDALINYVTGVGYISNPEQFKKFWPADIHVVGKDISKFHCIIWPALLLAAGLELPRGVVVHGYLTIGGEKMSKSIGNVIDPTEWAAKYGSDAVRYLLMREVAFGQDGDVSEEKLKSRYDSELANGLGNLVSRITTLVEKYLDGNLGQEITREVSEGLDIDRDVEDFKFHDALAKIWQLVAIGNKIVDENKLWEQGKTDVEAFRTNCISVFKILANVAHLISPFMPEASAKISEIVYAKKIIKAEPMFPRI